MFFFSTQFIVFYEIYRLECVICNIIYGSLIYKLSLDVGFHSVLKDINYLFA
jgi:hypothetical protein